MLENCLYIFIYIYIQTYVVVNIYTRTYVCVSFKCSEVHIYIDGGIVNILPALL